jgi:hypothetical protein
MRHDPSHDLETAEPSPSLLAALDITEKELAERELVSDRRRLTNKPQPMFRD